MNLQLVSLIVALFLFACRDKRISQDSDTIVSEKASLRSGMTRDIHLTARPDSISFASSSTAVIVVDMQNDFGTKGGLFDIAGIDISIIQKVVKPISNVLVAARKKGIKIIYLKMGFLPDMSDFGKRESASKMRQLIGDTFPAPNGSIGRFLIRDTWNTDIVSQLEPQPEDIVIYKSRYSGFYKTTLDSILRQLEKKYLIFAGCTTSICVESTVRDATFRDYMSIVLEDCTAEPIGNGLPRSNHEASLLNIQTNFGWVSNSTEFIKSIQNLSVLTSSKPQ
jgi:ureidoacrylate peracid hydrolase